MTLGSGAKLSLPLTQEFLLKTESLEEGVVPASDNGFWQLPMNLHSSFHHIFGYELNSTGKVRAISNPDKGPILPVGFNQPCRILVALALGCASERNDFEPGGVLGAARLLPHLMIITNKQVESVEGAITLTRNERTPHVAMGDDQMTPEVFSGLYTDNNDTTVTPELPYWNLLFDYYWTDPTPGKFEIVKRNASKRHSAKAVKFLREKFVSSPMGSWPAHGSQDETALGNRSEKPTWVEAKRACVHGSLLCSRLLSHPLALGQSPLRSSRLVRHQSQVGPRVGRRRTLITRNALLGAGSTTGPL